MWELWELPDQKITRIFFDLDIGKVGKDASDIFSSAIFTGGADLVYVEKFGPLPYDGRVFIFDRFEGVKIWKHLEDVVASCARSTWEETALELNRYFLWEFEGL
jgi:hypothetical protein